MSADTSDAFCGKIMLLLLLLPKRKEEDLTNFRAEACLPPSLELVFIRSTLVLDVGSETARQDSALLNFRAFGGMDGIRTERFDFSLNRLFFCRFDVTVPGGGELLSRRNERQESSIDESDRSLQSTAMDFGTEILVA